MTDSVAAGAQQLAHWIRQSTGVVALTGAGASTDSGIPDFRSASGLWAQHDPTKLASISGFLDDPRGFYAFWRDRFGSLSRAQPSLVHRVLAQLEARSLLHAVVTQNIDGLHQRAGSQRVLEVHGSWKDARCVRCGTRYDTERMLADLGTAAVPTCDLCAGLLKPDVVLFGEDLPPAFAEAERIVDRCDLLIALGTSLEVWPVAGLAERASVAGARVVIVNREETSADGHADLVVHGELRDVLLRVAVDFELGR